VLTEEGVPVARSAGRARREVLLTGLTARLDDAELAELEPVLAKVADPDAPAGQAGGSSPGRRR
jgi:hypothetical protein